MTHYTNLDGTVPSQGLLDLLKWQIERPRGAQPPYTTPRRENDGAAVAANTPSLTWIGHATYAMRLGGKLVVTDPIWSPNIQYASARLTAPGVPFERMPPIDIVTVSHAHYDHLDIPTLTRIGNRALFIVPKDVGPILRSHGLTRVVELAWWETHREGDLAITLVPAQHWSMRFPWDRNKRLWGGFVYESSQGTAYHAGDTAFSERVFRAIGERFPKIDWAMLPIGAYNPEWFMRPQHMGPEEAGRACKLVLATHLCAMHWGTFKLTDEPIGEPPERMRAWWAKQGHDAARLWIFDIGETRTLTARDVKPAS